MLTYLYGIGSVKRRWQRRLSRDFHAGRVSSVTVTGRRRLPRASATVCKLKSKTACLQRRSATATEPVGAASNHASNTETNATRSEVTVALAHTRTSIHTYTNTHTKGMLLSLTEICTGMQFHQGEHTAVEYSESGSEGQASHTENKVISRGYGFITHGLHLGVLRSCRHNKGY